jgi:uncharacterized protein (DUF2235 family)
MQLLNRLRSLIGLGRKPRPEPPRAQGGIDHVIILDGTMSSLEPECESNASITYRLLEPVAARPDSTLHLHYEPGVQWRGWKSARDVALGRGINRQIRRVYAVLAARYQPGDRVFLFGYSRGAFAVRSLAGMIDMVGLLTPEHCNTRNVRAAYRHYECGPHTEAAQAFAARKCHDRVEIEMIGVWDTVKALGLQWPVLWRLSESAHAFHSHHLGRSVRHGFHALALHETRVAYAPVMWDSDSNWPGHVQQVWFRGAHGDVGGHLGQFKEARPLANIPLVWMLERAETLGLEMPDDWRQQFPCDASAPSVGSFRGWGKMFLLRRARHVGLDPSESIHRSAREVLPQPKPAMAEPEQASTVEPSAPEQSSPELS